MWLILCDGRDLGSPLRFKSGVRALRDVDGRWTFLFESCSGTEVEHAYGARLVYRKKRSLDIATPPHQDV